MASDFDIAPSPVPPILAGFNRYGLPGLVIGAQFLIIAGLLYFGIGALRDATRAMADMTGAMNQLSQTLRDKR